MSYKGHDSWQWGRREQEIITAQSGRRLHLGVVGQTEVLPLGRLKLAQSDRPFVRIVSLGELLQGEIAFAAEISNPGSRAAQVDLSLRKLHIESGRDESTFRLAEETITVAPGETALFTYDTTFED